MNAGLIGGFGGPVSGGKPRRVVTYTSGTGTFTPLAAGSWCRITLLGGGAGGSRATAAGTTARGGASAGNCSTAWLRIDAPVTYIVGAGGPGATANNTIGTFGAVTKFGYLIAQGGSATGDQNAIPSGPLESGIDGFSGGVGGQGGAAASNGGNGQAPGVTSGSTGGTGGVGGVATPVYGGGGGGGSSPYGGGGVGGDGHATVGLPGGNATGYGGAGGSGGAALTTTGNGGNGYGGLIIIEEFGA